VYGVSILVCWSVCLSVCPSVLQNIVTRTTSALLHGLRWNFAYAFVMRCKCAWHNFHMRHSTNYGVIAPYSTLKILWREQLLHFPRLTWHFTYAFVVRCRCVWHNFHMRHSTYGVIAPYTTLKILLRKLLLHCFPDWHEVLHMHL